MPLGLRKPYSTPDHIQLRCAELFETKHQIPRPYPALARSQLVLNVRFYQFQASVPNLV